MANRSVTLATTAVEARYDDWIADIDARIKDPSTDRNELCIELCKGFYGVPDAPRNIHEEILLLSFDPRNATLEAEYYSELVEAKWYPIKPLIWLWQMFDNSPLNANVWLGLKFRSMLAQHIFKACGKGVKFFTGIEWSFGYNISIGDGAFIHRFVLLDDRGTITIKDGASISDYANIYSHWHDLVEPKIVNLGDTVIGVGARVAYHATVLSGTQVGDWAMVGAFGLATHNIPDYNVAIGLPAHARRLKPNAPEEVAAKHPNLKR